MNEKQQQLTFDKGMTNIPSDALCSDNALAYENGMTLDNGEHKFIQSPKMHMNQYVGCNEMPHFLYIHKTNIEIYIGYFSSSSDLRITFGYKDPNVENLYVALGILTDLRYTSKTKITSIGKTLIISDANGMHYYLWDVDWNSYKSLGDRIPEPHMKFWLEGGQTYYKWPAADVNWYEQHFGFDGDVDYLSYNTVVNNASTVGIIVDREGHGAWIETDADEKYNDLIVGLYSKNKKAICGKKAFCEPFFVRYALRLYDNSLCYISNPILLFPSVTRNTYFLYANGAERIMALTTFCYLHYSMDIDGDLGDFSDIVKDVDIFASNSINIYDTTVQQPIEHKANSRTVELFDGIFHDSRSETELSSSMYRIITDNNSTWWNTDGYIGGMRLDCLQKRPPEEIINNIKDQSIFYKICSVGLKPASGNLAEKIDSHTLENLTTQEQIDADDYFSRCKLYPDSIFAYNSRINLSSVSRGFFEGYDFFMPFVGVQSHGQVDITATYDFYVTIRSDQRSVTVKHTAEVRDQIQGIYFFYPDSRANHVTIIKRVSGNETCVCDEDLKEHGGLNGAYFFKGLPGVQITTEPTATTPTLPTPNNNANEQLPNYIVTSEVNNPFVFKAEGYNKVGTGRILGMSTITQALSQGQFGQFPLLVFSESGVWAMSLDRTGLFTSIHPLSREVCNNAESITQTDSAVFFTSEKGLMAVVGGDVKCVSEQLNGKIDTFATTLATIPSFKDAIKNCKIAYDYRDSLLWLLINNYPGAYIYNIKEGVFSFRSVNIIDNIVNNYPDTLLQTQTRELESLLERVNINDDISNSYGGIIITRPMKLENAFAMKSLMQIRNVYDVSGSVSMRIFASNNLDNWIELHSLRGTPWKYYRFVYNFLNMKATDRFAGSVVITQERRTNKLR